MLNVEGLACKLGAFELQDASFSLEAGDYFVLLGESGAGKTVILELLCGLATPARGRIRLNGVDISEAPIQRRDLGLVYQDHALFPHMTVRRNIAYALPRRERRQAAVLAEQVGATALLERTPATLSLGEAQRVALARTLARRPRVLMLDEPLASLDAPARAGIRSLLRRLNAAGQTILHVTHDYEEALALASRVGVLEKGRIVQIGAPDEVFHHPRSRFVAGFVGIKNFFRGRLEGDRDGQRFETPGARFVVATEEAAGSGCIVFESEAVTVSIEEPHGSARNVFHGTVAEFETVKRGVELAVDIGVSVYALITQASLESMAIATGRDVWVSVKSTAVRFLPDEVGP